MNTVSSGLPPSAFSHSPGITIQTWSSKPIDVSPNTSLEIVITMQESVKTPKWRKQHSLTVLLIPRGMEIANWRTKSALLIQIQPSKKQSMATTWLEGIVEYGVGKDDSEAISDLINSLGEYKYALEGRVPNLGEQALKELDTLRNLIE